MLWLCNAMGQQLEGLWTGTLIQGAGGLSESYSYELVLKPDGKGVWRGRALIRSGEMYGELAFRGVWRDSILGLQDTRILVSNLPPDAEWCLKYSRLTLIPGRTRWTLKGPWTGETKFGPCSPGTIRVHRKPPKPKPRPKRPPIVIKPVIRDTSVVEGLPTPDPMEAAPVVESVSPNPPRAKLVFEGDSLSEIAGREARTGHHAIVQQAHIEVSVYDHQRVDGDSISLYYNDLRLLNGHRLIHKPKVLELDLDPGARVHTLVLHAENLGVQPPNTAAVLVNDGQTVQKFILVSTLESSDVIYIEYLGK